MAYPAALITRRLSRGALIVASLTALAACAQSPLAHDGGSGAGRGALKRVSIHGGPPTILAEGLDKPFSLVVDGSFVYFSEMGAGAIKKVPIQGGRTVTLVDGLLDPRDLVVEGGWVYFAERGGGAIKRVPTQGGAVVTLAGGLSGPMKLALDAEAVYFCEYGKEGAIKKIAREARNGPAATLMEGLHFPFGTAIAGRQVYFVEQTMSGTLNSADLSGGSRRILLSGLKMPELLAFDQGHVYFAEGGGGTIKKVAVSDGAVATLASGLMTPGGTDIDAANVYFVDSRAGTVNKISKNGGPVTTLVSGAHDPFRVKVDHDALYFVEGFNPFRDDRTLFYSANEPPPFLNVVDQKLLTIDGWNGNPIWSPDGSQIAYVHNTLLGGSPGTGGDIWVMNSDGSGKRPLTSDGLDNRYASWSPDGRRIAFSSFRSGRYDIWTMDADGTHPVQLTAHAKSNLQPVWSPNGEKIAFASSRSGRTAIWMMNPDGTSPERVSPEGTGAYYAAWNPAGTKLAFSSDKIAPLNPWARWMSRWSNNDDLFYNLMNPTIGRAQSLWLLDLGSHELSRLTEGAYADDRPVWSPDGQFLLFNRRSHDDVPYSLWLLHIHTGAVRQLGEITSQQKMFPNWSPDGRHLAITSSLPSGSNVWVLTLGAGTAVAAAADAPPAQPVVQ